MKKEKLVWMHGRWEIARIAINRVTGREQWERRDGSYVCDVDTTECTHDMPKAPE